MTITTEESTVHYIGNGVTDIFSFAFKTFEVDDIIAGIDGVASTNILVVLNPDQDISPGGTVEFLDGPPAAQTDVFIGRVVPKTQETDYQEYDPFPAASHERALDKLTMLVQQQVNVFENSLRVPLSDPPDINKELPGPAERALQFPFFDEFGNLVLSIGTDIGDSVKRIDVAADSVTMLITDNVTNPEFPTIGVNNINGTLGLVQLTANGKVPLANMPIGGINIRGPIRGDDLCDKPGDEPLECTVPDTRNPSERFPSLVPTFPGEANKFSTGDIFLLTFQDPETDGTMRLFPTIAAPEDILDVKPRDGIVFLSGWDIAGDPTPNAPQGWYYIPKIYDVGDANSITYSPDGNFIISLVATNVQTAMDQLDQLAVDTQDRNQIILGQKTFSDPVGSNAPSAPDSLTRRDYVDDADAVNSGEAAAAQATAETAQSAAEAANVNANTRKPEFDFIRSGDRLDINNVRTS